MAVPSCFDFGNILETRLSKVSSEVRAETLDGLMRLMRDHLTRDGKNVEDIIGNNHEASDLVTGAWKELVDIVRKPIDAIRTIEKLKEDTPENIKKLEDLLENKYAKFRDNYHITTQEEAIKKNLNLRLQRFGLHPILDPSDIVNQFNDREGDGAQRESIQVNHMEVDPRSLSKASVKFILGTLRDETYDEHGSIIPVKSKLGLTKLVPFNKVQTVLLNSLNGLSNIDSMFKELDRLFLKDGKYKKGYLWIQELKNEYKVGLPISSLPDLRNRVAFEISNSNTSIDVIKSIISPGGVKFMDPVGATNANDIRFKWQNNAKIDVDTTKGKSIFTAVGNRMEINRKSQDYKDFINTKAVKSTEQILEKLKLIGIDFEKDPSELEVYKDQLGKAYYAIAEQLRKENSNIIRYEDLYESNIIGGRLNDLIKLYDNLNPAERSSSFQNANGKLSHNKIHPSTASILIDGLNQSSSLQEFKSRFPQLGDHNKYIQRSALLAPGGILFNAKGERRGEIRYMLISGTGIGGSLEGKTTEDLGRLDRISQEVNHILDNTYYLGINSDKSRELAMGLSQPFIPYLRVLDDKFITNKWKDYLEDEMDAAFQEKISPSYIDGYHTEVFKFGYFRDILSPKLVESFNKQVIDKSKNADDYLLNKQDWLRKNFSTLSDHIMSYIDDTSSKYVNYLESEGIIERKGKDYITNLLNNRTLSSILDREIPENVNGIVLSKAEVYNLSRYLNTNYEVSRQEQNKLFYGHPASYKDPVKRLAMLHAPKNGFSQNPDVLQHLQFTYPRLDGRDRTTSTLIQFRAYKEPIMAQEGHENLAEYFYEQLSPFQKDKKVLEEALGARFDDKGKFVSLILQKDKPTGQMKEWLSVKGADSQVYALSDHYWSFRIQSGNMNTEDWNRFSYDRAFEVNDRSSRDPKDPAYKKFSSQLIQEARETLDRYKNDKAFKASVEDSPRGVYKPQYFGYSNMQGLSHVVGLKMAVKPLSWKEVKGTTLEDVYIHHQAQGDDMFGFPSAEKFGVVNDKNGEIPDFYNESGEYSKNLPPLQELYPEYLGIQTEVPVEKRKVLGSQVLKIIMSNTHQEHHDEVKQYIDTLSNMYNHAGNMVMKKLGLVEKDGEYYTTDVRRFVAEVRNKASGWGVTDNQIDSILSVKQKDGTYQLLTKFDALPSRERFENILWGMINRKIVNREMYGIPAVQVSDLGLEQKGTKKLGYFDKTTQKLVRVDQATTLTPDQKKNLVVLSPYDSIPHIENGEVKAANITTVWHETKLSPKEVGLVKGKDGLWRDEKGVLPEEFFEALGFRIPTDSMGSIIPLRTHAFFDPSEGDIAARPAGQIVKDGSDFDVDKFNQILSGIYKYNGRYFWNGDYKSDTDLQKRAEQVYEDKFGQSYNGNRLLFDKIYDDQDDIAKREEFIDNFKTQALQNKLLKHMSNLLLAKQNYMALMNPISMGPIPDVAERVLKAKGISPDESNTTKVHQLQFSQEARYTYLTSKKLVGIVARSATLNVMAQKHVCDIQLTGKYNKAPLFYLEKTRKKDFIGFTQTSKDMLKNTPIHIPFEHNKDDSGNPAMGQVRDVDGNLISSNISNSLQASVDGIKNPALAYLNINLNTMSQYQYLIGKGVSPERHALLFFPQPSLVELSKQLGINQAMGTRVNDNVISRAELIWKVASKFYDGGDTYRNYEDARSEAFSLSNILNDYASRKTLSYGDIKDMESRMFKKFEESRTYLEPMLKDINEYKKKLTTITQKQLERGLLFDVKGWTAQEDRLFQAAILFYSEEFKQQSSQEFTLNNYLNIDTQKPKTFAADDVRDLLYNKLERSNYVKNPETLFQNSQLEALQRNLDRVDPMSKNYFLGADPRIKTIMKKMLDKLDDDDIVMRGGDKEDLINRFQNFTLSRILLTTEGEKGRMLLGDYNKALFGSKSSARILAKLKKQYSDSFALKALSFEISQDPKKPDSMRLFKYNTNIYDLNQITDSLLNLYSRATDQETKDWVKNLGIYSIIQNGLQGTRSSIQRVLPTEVYSELVGKVLDTFQSRELSGEDLDKFAELNYKQFHQVNSRQDSIVPRVKKFSIKAMADNGNLISLNHLDYSAPHDFIKRSVLKREIPESQRAINEENGEGYKNFETQLFEKINKDADANSQDIWYKRINILGEQGKFNEVYPQDFQHSLIEDNGKFNELDPSYRLAVGIRSKDENFVPLQDMETTKYIPTSEENVETRKTLSTFGYPTSFKEITNHSGGALGSDTEGWDNIGKEFGMENNKHYWHGVKTPGGDIELTSEQLEEGWKHVLKANESLHRRPEKYKSLLSRNWQQVANSEEIFAISSLANEKTVDGGTGWAVQMAIDAKKPVHVFDQERNQWFKYSYENSKFEPSDTPILTKDFAGIGTRELKENGKQAIKDVYTKTQEVLSFEGKQTESPISDKSLEELYKERGEKSGGEEAPFKGGKEYTFESYKEDATEFYNLLKKVDPNTPNQEIMERIKSCI